MVVVVRELGRVCLMKRVFQNRRGVSAGIIYETVLYKSIQLRPLCKKYQLIRCLSICIRVFQGKKGELRHPGVPTLSPTVVLGGLFAA